MARGKKTFQISGQLKFDIKNFQAGVHTVSKNLSRISRDASRSAAQMAKSFERMGKDMAILGGGGLLAIGLALKKVADSGGELVDLSNQLGIATNALSELRYAASMSGVEMEKLAGGIQKMQKTMGSGQADDALKRLGLDPEALKRAAPDEAFTAIVDALGKIQSQNIRMNLAQQIFGKGGGEFLRLAKDGAAGIRALREEARSVGASVDPKTAAQWDNIGDSFDQLMQRTLNLSRVFANQLAPAIQWTLDKLNAGLTIVSQWLQQHPVLTKAVGMSAIAFSGLAFAAGAGLIVLGKVFGAIAGGLEAVKTLSNWLATMTKRKVADTAATVADTIATQANTAAKLENAAAGALGGKAGLLGKAGNLITGALGKAGMVKTAAVLTAEVGAGVSAAAITAGAVGGGYAGKKMFDAGWANEGRPAGWLLGGIGRKIGDWWGGRDPDRNMGERTRQLMNEGKLGNGSNSPASVSDPENNRLMQEQNTQLRELNDTMRQMLRNTRPQVGMNSNPMMPY